MPNDPSVHIDRARALRDAGTALADLRVAREERAERITSAAVYLPRLASELEAVIDAVIGSAVPVQAVAPTEVEARALRWIFGFLVVDEAEWPTMQGAARAFVRRLDEASA